MNDKAKEKEKNDKSEKQPLAEPPATEMTKEQLVSQLNYAQKIINVLQGKVNDANGKMVQLEAQIIMANEDRENILKQVETMGITPK
tara:strand:- start:202 stop:462 length:261 start_codon:yes stop_codon:yes gene_type:complete